MKAVVSIANPCSENWGEMRQIEGGKHCSSCNSTVKDLSGMSQEDLQNFIRENWGKKVCGRLHRSQVDKVVVDVSDQTFFTRRTWQGSFMLAVFLVFGSTLISGTSYAGNRASFYISSTYNKFQELQDSTQKKNLLPTVVKADTLQDQAETHVMGKLIMNEEQPASFPGGQAKLMEYMDKSLSRINVPDRNQRMVLQFSVDEQGNINDISVVRTTGYDQVDRLVVNAVAEMPKWKPAKKGNIRVSSRYTLPVHFSK